MKISQGSSQWAGVTGEEMARVNWIATALANVLWGYCVELSTVERDRWTAAPADSEEQDRLSIVVIDLSTSCSRRGKTERTFWRDSFSGGKLATDSSSQTSFHKCDWVSCEKTKPSQVSWEIDVWTKLRKPFPLELVTAMPWALWVTKTVRWQAQFFIHFDCRISQKCVNIPQKCCSTNALSEMLIRSNDSGFRVKWNPQSELSSVNADQCSICGNLAPLRNSDFSSKKGA